MSTLILTLIASVLLMSLVVCGFAIGKLLTGKNRLHKRCGWTPKDGSGCRMCGKTKPCDKEPSDQP